VGVINLKQEKGEVMTVEEMQAKLQEAEDRIAALNGEAAKYRKTASERAEELKKYEGLDLDEVNRLKDDAAKIEEEKMKAAGRFDELKSNIEKDYSAKLTAAQEFGTGWQQKYESLAIDKALVDAAAKYNGIAPEEIAQLTRGQIKLGENGSPIILNPDGGPAIDEKGNALSIDAFVGSWLQAHPHHVRASGGGAGSNNLTNQGNSGIRTISAEDIGKNLEAVAKGELKVAS